MATCVNWVPVELSSLTVMLETVAAAAVSRHTAARVTRLVPADIAKVFVVVTV
ncbi:MAG TPA: hypothetical protein VGK67_19205 [Myxococcales bacterium]